MANRASQGANASGNAVSAASLSESMKKQANMRLLQRTCLQEISDIVQTATHVVLYEFVEAAWSKSNVEGSLFLATTASGSAYLIILNRHSTENFQLQVTEQMQLQDQDPYLIFRQQQAGSDTVQILGIWFHSAEERVVMAASLEQTIQLFRQRPRVIPSTTSVTTTPTASSLAVVTSTATFTSGPTAAQPQIAGNSTTMTNQIYRPQQVDTDTAMATLLQPLTTTSSRTTTTAAVAAGDMETLSSQQPAAVAASTPTPSNSSAAALTNAGGVALDKKSLQLALLSLIQDDRFLDLLHSQYLRVVHSRAKKQQQQQNNKDNKNGPK